MEFNTQAPNPSSAANVFWPLLLLLSALILWFAFQLMQTIKLRENLAVIHSSQEPLIQNAQKIRQLTDALALGTLNLSKQGNPNAALIVNALAKRGININPQQQTQPKEAGQQSPAP
ncbi:MAG: hypothetical protein PHE55_12545 [Methylococcaceae bacterium]|nr:hypothetical protein [Methylococcaceae bacterium]